jgi:hypothetical protein
MDLMNNKSKKERLSLEVIKKSKCKSSKKSKTCTNRVIAT